MKHSMTSSITGNPLTKGLSPNVFPKHTVHMGVASFDDMSISWGLY